MPSVLRRCRRHFKRSISGRMRRTAGAGRSAEGRPRARIGVAKSVAAYEDLGIQQAPNSTLVSYLQKMLWILTGNFAKPGGVHMHFVVVFPSRGAGIRWASIGGLKANRLRRGVGLAALDVGAGPLRKVFARLSGGVGRLFAQGTARLSSAASSKRSPYRCGKRCRATRYTGRRHAQSVTGAPIISGLIPRRRFRGDPQRPSLAGQGPVGGCVQSVHSLPDSARWRRRSPRSI